jgi:hypothetical protein
VVLRGTDTPPGSWRRVWYRAIAWADDDPARGARGGRSPASPGFAVVVPPAAAPDLSAQIEIGPGAKEDEVLLRWASRAPVAPTPLGPHHLTVDVAVVGAPARERPALASYDLDKIPNKEPLEKPTDAAPPAIWRQSGLTGDSVGYTARLRRPASLPSVVGTIRLTDPLGRASEKPINIKSGPLPPDMDIVAVELRALESQRLLLVWASSAPIGPSGAEPYRLRLTAQPPRRRRRDRSDDEGPSVPAVLITMPLGEIPLLEAEGWPYSGAELLVRRRQVAGERQSYAALCTVPVQRFIIRIIAPDGRFVEATKEVL